MTFATYVLENATSLVTPQPNISSNKDIIRDLAPGLVSMNSGSHWKGEVLEIIEDVKAMSLENLRSSPSMSSHIPFYLLTQII